ncbi:MAG: glucokinase, partial [Pseudomonadales bacterium]|nr:glucokinase [Pseudomonadales bacterium]
WSFNIAAMAQRLALTEFKVLNDFTSMAYETLALQAEDKVLVQQGCAMQHSPRLVIGPGTGLGVASLVPMAATCDTDSIAGENRWQAVATEGGHISFAPLDSLQIQIWQILQQQYGRVSVERILCGDGILALYLAICKIKRSKVLLSNAAEITDAAKQRSNAEAVLSMQSFCQILGAVTGDMVLAQGARGGVYLCGGILPRVQEFLLESEFSAAMANKGRLRDYTSSVPVWLCNSEYPGLLGAATALKMKSV